MIRRHSKLRRQLRRFMNWGQRTLPWGVRSVIGAPLIVLGLFGFLPVLGFWMIPLGLALIALDVPALRRRLRRWLDRRNAHD